MKPKCTFKDLCTKTGSHAPAFMTNSFGSGKLIRIRNTDMNYRCYSIFICPFCVHCTKIFLKYVTICMSFVYRIEQHNAEYSKNKFNSEELMFIIVDN